MILSILGSQQLLIYMFCINFRSQILHNLSFQTKLNSLKSDSFHHKPTISIEITATTVGLIGPKVKDNNYDDDDKDTDDDDGNLSNNFLGYFSGSKQLNSILPTEDLLQKHEME